MFNVLIRLMLTYHLEQSSNRRKFATASLVFFQSLVCSLTLASIIFRIVLIAFDLKLKFNSGKFASPARRLPEVAER